MRNAIQGNDLDSLKTITKKKIIFFTQITATITLENNIFIIDNNLEPLLNIIKTITMSIIILTIQKTKPSPQLGWMVVVIRRMIVSKLSSSSKSPQPSSFKLASKS